ncbi:hypothetical protein K239x_09360 [Planctomycetes bacterium K23_9]|uniref:Uncharacterized protein n=2 Tax=Stieleria marina TaxID=1930275 RepID=A0A517NPF1_9BACT|nr:hypothetical protein K239x_09360 [Planctomycetes bacterium K23_9]
MHASRWSPVVCSLIVVTMTLGCRGTAPQRQQIQLTEDLSIRQSNVKELPQRLAVSIPTQTPDNAQATNDKTSITLPQNSVTPPKSNSVKTRLANSQTVATPTTAKQSSQDPFAVAKSVVQRQTVAKQPSDESAAMRAPAAARQPQRSDAVEALLAANRMKTRAKQAAQSSQPATQRSQNKQPEEPKPQASTTRTLAKAKATTTEIKPTRKTRFSELPADVRKRAMQRLIANLSKNADATAQPDSVNQQLLSALDQLPELSPLKKTRSETAPNRIGSGRSGSTPKTQQLAAKQPSSVNQIEPAKQTKRRSVLRDIQVSDLVAPTRKASDQNQLELPATDGSRYPQMPEVVFSKSPQPSANASRPQPQSPEPRSIQPSQPSKQPSPVAVAESVKSSEGSFLLPALPTKPQPKVAEAAARRNTQWVLPPFPQVVEPKIAAKTTTTQKGKTDTSVASANKLSERKAVERASESLAFSSLSKELNVLPHELHREQFRVSRVGLPSPDDLIERLQNDDIVSEDTSRKNTVRQVASHQQIKPDDRMLPKSILVPSDMPQSGGSQTVGQTDTADIHRSSIELPNVNSAKHITKEPDVSLESPVSIVKTEVADATLTVPVSPAVSKQSTPTATGSLAAAQKTTSPQAMTDKQLYDALLARLTDPDKAETPAENNRRQIMARHLMVLAGNHEAALKDLKGLSNEEQQFLRNQLEGLHTIVDPNGHPVAGRRFSSALPKLRQATMHLSAAATALEVRSLEFCTEIEAYGQIKPFPSRQFTPGQPVILYCEVENFAVRKIDAGFETHLKGSYDVYNEAGEKMIAQPLPADKQISRNVLRDYFVAYQMSLPTKLAPGKYRLQLTMEDVGVEKYGQSAIQFEIIAAPAAVRTQGGTL